jgi:iron complex transport system permease protein
MNRRHAWIFLCFAALLLLSFIISMNTGFTRLSPIDTVRTLLGGGTDKENLVLFQFRLPRIVISILVGAGLALSGCIIQGVSRNALADPGLLGINAGAGLFVVLFVMAWGAKTAVTIFALPFLALAGAGGAAVLIYLLAYKKEEGISPLRLVLVGIAVQAGIGAAMTVLVLALDESQFDFIVLWQAGSIWGSNWKFVVALLPWLLLLVPYAMMKAPVLDTLHLGDEIAGGLGTKVESERRKLLAAAVALAASSVAVSGSISFVGLIAPHLARRLVGTGHRLLLPACALCGALLVSASDTIGRLIVQPDEIPVGIVVAVVGAPYFLYLLARSRR